MNKYVYTLHIEFESGQPIQEERLDLLDTQDYSTSEHIEQLLIHRKINKVKETIEFHDPTQLS